MKTIKVILIIIAIAIINNVYSQVGYKGQWMATVYGGVNSKGGFYMDAKAGIYITPGSVIGGGVMYMKSRYLALDEERFSVSHILFNGYYQYPIILKRFNIAPQGGILLGGEICDQNTNKGNYLKYGSKFVVGLQASISFEYLFNSHWALGIEPRLMYLINTNFDNVVLSCGIGVKYYF